MSHQELIINAGAKPLHSAASGNFSSARRRARLPRALRESQRILFLPLSRSTSGMERNPHSPPRTMRPGFRSVLHSSSWRRSWLLRTAVRWDYSDFARHRQSGAVLTHDPGHDSAARAPKRRIVLEGPPRDHPGSVSGGSRADSSAHRCRSPGAASPGWRHLDEDA